jgi:hypothetical protein
MDIVTVEILAVCPVAIFSKTKFNNEAQHLNPNRGFSADC